MKIEDLALKRLGELDLWKPKNSLERRDKMIAQRTLRSLFQTIEAK